MHSQASSHAYTLGIKPNVRYIIGWENLKRSRERIEKYRVDRVGFYHQNSHDNIAGVRVTFVCMQLGFNNNWTL